MRGARREGGEAWEGGLRGFREERECEGRQEGRKGEKGRKTTPSAPGPPCRIPLPPFALHGVFLPFGSRVEFLYNPFLTSGGL
jgi:hypothetical protein